MATWKVLVGRRCFLMKMGMVKFLTARFSITFLLSFFCCTSSSQLHASWSVFTIWKCGFDLAFEALAMSFIAEHCVEHFPSTVFHVGAFSNPTLLLLFILHLTLKCMNVISCSNLNGLYRHLSMEICKVRHVCCWTLYIPIPKCGYGDFTLVT